MLVPLPKTPYLMTTDMGLMQTAHWMVLLTFLLAPAAMAQPVFDPVDAAQQTAGAVVDTTTEVGREATEDLGATEQIWDLVDPSDKEPEAEAGPGLGNGEPDFSDRVASAIRDDVALWGVGSAALAVLSVGGFFAVTRYISPKEALKNPQRSMLYGFIRGNPGAHLKQLSEEFAMKTSSILWHIRKLESAELVKSERVGGYRVFYAVDGGIEIKRVSRAITSLQNENARHIFGRIQRRPGSTTRQISEALNIHGGTVRWHLRKLRDAGLLDELVQETGSRFYNTPLGDRALETMEGAPTSGPAAGSNPTPE